jgi:hypothetical protein
MRLDALPMSQRSIPSDRAPEGGTGFKEQAEAIEPFGSHYRSDLTLRTRCPRTFGPRSPNVPTPIRPVIRVHAVGKPISDHDVSGTGWQTLGDRAREGGRAMQSITTMVPVWQCGHSRNDCPVNASKRSR